jgi:hypothetical protein
MKMVHNSIYYNKIGFQKNESVDSNSLAFAIKKFVEKLDNDILNNNAILFEGTPLELLEEPNKIANQEGIDTNQREWPRDRKWLVKRINIIKSNPQQVLTIKISLDTDSNNTSIIKIRRNISGNSVDLDLSPVSNGLSPEENQNLSTKSNNSRYTGYTGDKLDVI